MSKNQEESSGQRNPNPPPSKLKFGPAASGPGESKTPPPRGKSPGSIEEELESATESIDSDEATRARTSLDLRSQTGSVGETEELFVILPEEESGQLPVVETMVVEEQPWESGPTATELLKDVPEDLSVADTSTGALDDVPLRKTNPLSTGLVSDEDDGDTEDVGIARDDEIKVIEEIADIAADLESEEPPPESESEPDEPRARVSPVVPAHEEQVAAPAGGNRKKFLILGSAIAALVLAGVFFHSDLERIFLKKSGGEGTGSGTVAVTKVPVPVPVPVGPRDELRAKIHLAMQLGLRGEAGKE
jgi:hypothetical protein